MLAPEFGEAAVSGALKSLRNRTKKEDRPKKEKEVRELGIEKLYPAENLTRKRSGAGRPSLRNGRWERGFPSLVFAATVRAQIREQCSRVINDCTDAMRNASRLPPQLGEDPDAARAQEEEEEVVEGEYIGTPAAILRMFNWGSRRGTYYDSRGFGMRPNEHTLWAKSRLYRHRSKRAPAYFSAIFEIIHKIHQAIDTSHS